MKPNRSPIKDPLLRLPGDSLLRERERIWDDKLELPFILALFFVLLASLEWYRLWFPSLGWHWAFTAAAVLAVGFATYRFIKYLPRLRALRQGRDGEVAVGQFLERLRAQGYQVFHDVRGPNFNIDHVLIGPAGVVTVETKTWSKPSRGEARIRVEAEAIVAGAARPDSAPIAQARAQAAWLRRMLEESTGRRPATRPVVVFPGWFIERSPGGANDVWVLEPKALPAFLDREPAVLTPEDIKLYSFHLGRLIRADHRDDEATRGRWKTQQR